MGAQQACKIRLDLFNVYANTFSQLRYTLSWAITGIMNGVYYDVRLLLARRDKTGNIQRQHSLVQKRTPWNYPEELNLDLLDSSFFKMDIGGRSIYNVFLGQNL